MSDPSVYIDQIIANAIATADNYNEQAENAATDIINVNVGMYIEPPTNSAGFTVTAVEPEIPTIADSTIVADAELDKIVALLSNQLAGFFATYYPLASDAFDEATTWLINTITNGGTGINASVEDQAWQRDRDRIVADGRRVKYQIITGYAAKGISLPAGSMLKKMEEVDYAGYGELGKASTAKAVEQLRVEIETVRFAITSAMQSRTMAMQAAADYIRSVASAPDSATRLASLNTDNQARMMSAAADFYRSRLTRDELVLQSKLAEMNTGVDVYKHRRDNATENDRVKVQALAAAADVFARTAQASLMSLNTVASTATSAFA